MVQFIGHHGTSLRIAECIMERNFIIRPGKVGWLGTGVYFFEEEVLLAEN